MLIYYSTNEALTLISDLDAHICIILLSLVPGVWYYKDWETVTLQPGNRQVTREACFQYPDSVGFDAKWKTAKSFTIITGVIGAVVLFWTWLAPCFYGAPRIWKPAAVTFLMLTLFQGLTLLFLGSNACTNNGMVNVTGSQADLYSDKCIFYWGTRLNITSVVFWFVAGVLMLTVIPAPVRPEAPPPETQTVTYTKTEEPDGTQVVTENTVKGQYIPAEKKEEPVPKVEDP